MSVAWGAERAPASSSSHRSHRSSSFAFARGSVAGGDEAAPFFGVGVRRRRGGAQPADVLAPALAQPAEHVHGPFR